jgi:hypothetical protein
MKEINRSEEAVASKWKNTVRNTNQKKINKDTDIWTEATAPLYQLSFLITEYTLGTVSHRYNNLLDAECHDIGTVSLVVEVQ